MKIPILRFARTDALEVHATFFASKGVFYQVDLKKEKTSTWDLVTDDTANEMILLQWLYAYFHNKKLPKIATIPCTSFAQEVYGVIASIPKGKTMSYKAVAEALGNKAFRAVGRALGANPTPFLIPCHRVVRDDGSLGGFRDGLLVKQELLALDSELA